MTDALQDIPDDDPTELSVGAAAERAGIAVSTLHFYERQGLITSWRTSGNQRRYHRSTLRRVAFIRIAQSVGVPLAAVAEVLSDLPSNRVPTRSDWRELSSRWQDDLSGRIKRLAQLRERFSDCIGCGCMSLDHCMLANPFDRLGESGAGPRRLLLGLMDEPVPGTMDEVAFEKAEEV